MPELPEVETTRRGLAPYLEAQTVTGVVVRHNQLRYPLSATLPNDLRHQTLLQLSRRGKYLLFRFEAGTLLVHLGMSGVLRLVDRAAALGRHDHMDMVFSNHMTLRYTDPRRFGAILWSVLPPESHPLLKDLGPEPLSDEFSPEYLINKLSAKKSPIKAALMDSHVVVGVGNIYANEALFSACIHPALPAWQLSYDQCTHLVMAIQQVLTRAISQGGTTLKDFVNGEGKPGYFSQQLQVYGRGNKPCLVCKTNLESVVLRQRQTVFCPQCQLDLR